MDPHIFHAFVSLPFPQTPHLIHFNSDGGGWGGTGVVVVVVGVGAKDASQTTARGVKHLRAAAWCEFLMKQRLKVIYTHDSKVPPKRSALPPPPASPSALLKVSAVAHRDGL